VHEIDDEIKIIRESFQGDLAAAKINGNFDGLFLKYFSKTHGIVTVLMKQLPTLEIGERKKYGKIANDLQNDFKVKMEEGKSTYIKELIKDPRIDLTLPVTPKSTGMMHPTSQLIREMNTFFRYYGYSVAEGPEIETDEYNFKRLNLPEDHPARDLQDTLWIKQPEFLLRTHSSSVEAHVLEDNKPPIRVVSPGKVFRNETASKTNSSFFHHYQGVVVDKGITIQHLKSTLELFHKFMFGDDVVLRFRYKYYPEVTPGMGTDMLCTFCKGAGCDVCKHRGWIEVLGSGMIHPNTLKASGIDPEVYTGFAFGMGLDRLVMQKYCINDIRKLYGGGMIYI
jgi:phenylalanyl-tRNA synthetase alpha chain